MHFSGSLSDFPTSYRWCGKIGKTGAFPKSPETGKAGKTGTIFFSCTFYKEAIFLVNNVINWRLNTRASWSLGYMNKYTNTRERARVMGYGE